ncbi:hypothetical protein WJX73_006782 [Symbiochloris irregularis]|uniref:F-box domain-containing protein n=1 Tax=Symbiochloris irregularis TaxID=706552 RepID=A0AAW1NYJ5_9CHLO
MKTAVALLDVPDILQQVILPLLDAPSLAVITCTCKDLRRLVYDSPGVFATAARRHLPRSYPLARSASRATLQAALKTYTAAQHNIAAGVYTKKELLEVTEASFNASGSHMAPKAREPFHAWSTQWSADCSSPLPELWKDGQPIRAAGEMVVAWSSGGKYLAVASEPRTSMCIAEKAPASGLVILDASSADLPVMANLDFGMNHFWIGHLHWTPDGTKLCAVGTTDNGDEQSYDDHYAHIFCFAG